MSSFIYKYFIGPIISGNGYNPVNTVTYAIGFVVAMYLTRWVFRKTGVEINKKWFDALFLIAIVGGFIRAIEDWIVKVYGVLPTHFLAVTPGIYFTLAAIVLIVLWRERERFNEIMRKLNLRLILILGFVVISILVTNGVHNIEYVTLILILAILVGEGIFRLMKKLKVAVDQDRWLLIGQSLDGFATAIALSMVPGYFEEHVVTNALIQHFGPVAYPVIKVAIAIIAVYLINTQMSDDKEWGWILRLFIVIIGLGPGTRDTTRLLMGV